MNKTTLVKISLVKSSYWIQSPVIAPCARSDNKICEAFKVEISHLPWLYDSIALIGEKKSKYSDSLCKNSSETLGMLKFMVKLLRRRPKFRDGNSNKDLDWRSKNGSFTITILECMVH